MSKKRIVIGATGASGIPLLLHCLAEIRKVPEYESWLIMSRGAQMTLRQETDLEPEEVFQMADYVLEPEDLGAGPASGSFAAEGMLIVPCSMKTAAGICSGYTDNLILRAADVAIKEQRKLVLAVRESPLSSIHLRNLYELSRIPGVRIVPPMMTYYHRPATLEEMTAQAAARLLEPFGIETEGYCRWNGMRG